ncbi:DUF3995 domain-containing protein [Chromobacterium haemolyticum]|uniref:DUF3995 domain-containing protein n=1 Tax=Chromobacterium haemolyticum TaxID=394935 RepID=UPI0009D93EFC|nr:DUF3995 domain-containing protein [Chromobacterium haemolyticum]OQS32399.1 hypothetical protein B0T39_22540 [Chromobacterium haemolyticum]
MLSLFLITVFLIISLVHCYWALGGTVGMGAAVPEVDGKPLFQPTRGGTFAVAGILALSALAVALHGHLTRFWQMETVRWGLLALAAALLLRGIGEFRYVGLFKSVRDSRFARNDTRFYSPLCLLLGSSLLILAW